VFELDLLEEVGMVVEKVRVLAEVGCDNFL
jgi:hypothetical protein